MLSTAKLSFGLAILLAISAAKVQADELTDAIPHDAVAVVILNNVKQTEQDLQAFVKACGVPAGVPMTLDQGLQQLPGLAEVVDRERPVAIVMVEALSPPVLFVPVKDTQTAVQKLNTTKQGDYYELESKGYVYPKGKYLIAAMTTDTLSQLKTVEKNYTSLLSSAQSKVLAESDLFYWVNIVPYRGIIQAGLDSGLSQMRDAFAQVARTQRQFGDLDDAEVERQEAMFDQVIEIYSLYFAGLKALVAQTETVHGGISISETAVTTQSQLQVTKASPLQVALEKIQPPSAPLFSNIPDKPYYIAMAGSARGLAEPFQQFTKAMYQLPSFRKLLEDEELKKAYEASLKAYSGLGDMSFVMDFGNGMTAYGAYEVDNPRGLLMQGRESIKLSQAVMQNMSAMGQPAMRIKLVEKDKAIAGLQVDEYWLDFEAPNEQTQLLLNAIYGASPRIQVAAQQNAVIFGMGAENNPIEAVVAPKSRLANSKSVQTTLKDLGPSSTMVMLIDPFGMLRLVKNIAETQQENTMKAKLPEGASPPFGVSLAVDRATVTIRTSVRSKTIDELIKIGPQLFFGGAQRRAK